jgi:hypothetical protein
MGFLLLRWFNAYAHLCFRSVFLELAWETPLQGGQMLVWLSQDAALGLRKKHGTIDNAVCA